ncbi:MAG: hypothetical protein KDB86_00645 [Actinobacteria bacterium]|nr:hypothetical protein [Actinomycetota bacterium]MCB9390883.1 hypothetical protein [Acidimicrobiia bacterium]
MRLIHLTLITLAAVLMGCGSDDDPGSAANAPTSVTSEPSAVTHEASTTAADGSGDTGSGDDGSGGDGSGDVTEKSGAPTVPDSVAGSEGSVATPLLDNAMAELEVPLGESLTPETVSNLFPWPADFPPTEGLIVGTQRSWERDHDSVEENRRIGIDEAATAQSLDAYSETIEAGGVWSRASTQRQSFLTDLYTNDAGDRIVLSSKTELEPGVAGLTYELEPAAPDALTPPEWVGALPAPNGGELVEWVEGVGPVQDAFSAGDPAGYVSIRIRYDDQDREPLVEHLQEVLGSAGFTVTDTMTLDSWTADVTTDGWSGQVYVGEWSSGEDTGQDVVWALSRTT